MFVLASDEGVVVDQHADLGFCGSLALVSATDQVAQRLGSELFTINAAIGTGSDEGGDFGVDGGEDGGSQLGVEDAVEVVHPVGVDSPREPGLTPLTLVTVDPGLGLQA